MAQRSLAALLLVLWASLASALELEGSTDALEVVTTTTATIDYQIKWANRTATALTTPGTSVGQITTATTTTAVAAPAASNWRLVTQASFRNASTTAANTLTVQVDRSAANRTIYQASLGPGESLAYDGTQWRIYSAAGLIRTVLSSTQGVTGLNFTFSKVATAFDTIGYHYAYMKDTGFPGAWAPGAPGLNGFNTDCSVASNATNPIGAVQMGTYPLPDASVAWYLTKFGLNSAVVGNFELIDILWVNTGIVVTTTTAQTITMPGALPARDNNGATNGAGIMAALYTTTANTNAAVVANSTLSYTDQDGNAGNTATFSGVVGFQAPATPVVGTWMPFILAAGDSGIRSVQSITLGTSYGAGALSLVLYRSLDREGVSVANTSSGALNGPDRTIASPGVRVYNDTCFALVATGAPATTAAGVYGGTIQLMDR